MLLSTYTSVYNNITTNTLSRVRKLKMVIKIYNNYIYPAHTPPCFYSYVRHISSDFNFRVDVSKGLTISHMASHPSNARYPDATAITFDKSNFKVSVIYNDHSIYVWDVRDINKVNHYIKQVLK